MTIDLLLQNICTRDFGQMFPFEVNAMESELSDHTFKNITSQLHLKITVPKAGLSLGDIASKSYLFFV